MVSTPKNSSSINGLLFSGILVTIITVPNDFHWIWLTYGLKVIRAYDQAVVDYIDKAAKYHKG